MKHDPDAPASLPKFVRMRKAVLQRVLPPVLVALATPPVFRVAMRRGPGKRVKHWLWQRVLQPYTARRRRPVVVESSYGRFASSGFMVGFVQRHLWMFDVWEPNLTRWIAGRLQRGDVFVDVGANIGYFSVLAANIVGPSGGVLAVEASPSTFETLRRNLELNGSTNARAVNVAVSNREAILPFYVQSSEDVAASLTQTAGARRVNVQAAPLHAILTGEELRQVRIMKIDVEGAELAALQGLTPVLDRMRPDLELAVEVSPGAFDSVRALLEGFGFHAYQLPNPLTPIEMSDRASRPVPIATLDAAQDRQFTEMIFSRCERAEAL